MNATLERIRELNYDHHRRMTIEHNRHVASGRQPGLNTDNADSLLNLTSRLGHTIGIRILELGASGGGDFDVLAAAFNTDDIKGIDVHEPSVLQAQERGHDVVVGFVEELPYDPASFDIVISRHVMEHVSDVDVALQGVKRVLKPGGMVAAVTPAYQPDPEPAHIQQLSLEEWVLAYRRNGLEVIYQELRMHACLESHIIASKGSS